MYIVSQIQRMGYRLLAAVLLSCVLVLLSSCVSASRNHTASVGESSEAGFNEFVRKSGLWESIEYSFARCPKPDVFKKDIAASRKSGGIGPAVNQDGVLLWLDYVDNGYKGEKEYLACFHGGRLMNVPPLSDKVSKLLEKSGLEYLSFRRKVRDRNLAKILNMDPQLLATQCASGDSLITMVVAFAYSRAAFINNRRDLRRRLFEGDSGDSCRRKVDAIQFLHVRGCNNSTRNCNRGINGSFFGILSELNRYGRFSR